MLKKIGVGIVVFILLLVVISYTERRMCGGKPCEFGSQEVTKIPTQPIPTMDQQRLWDHIQMWRRSQGLPEYIEDSFLCSIADKRIQEIQTNFSHDKFYEKIDCEQSCKLGENINSGYSKAQSALNGWLNSPLHRAALESTEYTHSCVRSMGDKSVQIFGHYF